MDAANACDVRVVLEGDWGEGGDGECAVGVEPRKRVCVCTVLTAQTMSTSSTPSLTRRALMHKAGHSCVSSVELVGFFFFPADCFAADCFAADCVFGLDGCSFPLSLSPAAATAAGWSWPLSVAGWGSRRHQHAERIIYATLNPQPPQLCNLRPNATGTNGKTTREQGGKRARG